jgi:hypothetical protein
VSVLAIRTRGFTLIEDYSSQHGYLKLGRQMENAIRGIFIPSSSTPGLDFSARPTPQLTSCCKGGHKKYI